MTLGPRACTCTCGHVGHYPGLPHACRHCDCEQFVPMEPTSVLEERASVVTWLEAWKVPAKVTPEAAVLIAASAIKRGDHRNG